MRPEELVEKASRLEEYIKYLISEVNTFEQSLNRTTVIAMRKSAIDEIKHAGSAQIEEEKRYSNENIIRIESSYYEGGTTYLLRPYTEFRPAQDDYEIFKSMFTVRLNVYYRLISELIASIQNGELDDQLHLTAYHLIYDKIQEAVKAETEPEIPMIPGVFVDEQTAEGKLVSYTCPYCNAPVLAPYSKKKREITCVACWKSFIPD